MTAQAETQRSVLYRCLTVLGLTLSLAGCNATGFIENPDDQLDLAEVAKAEIEDGKCDDAIVSISKVGQKTSATYQTLGWAHLCAAGAKLDNVLGAVLSYNSSSAELFMIGDLAKSLAPTSAGRQSHIDSAIDAFNNMDRGDQKQAQLTLAYLIKASEVIAQRSRDGGSISRDDIAPSSTCTSSSACPSTDAITDVQVGQVLTAVTAASNAASASATLGTAAELARTLLSVLNQSTTVAKRYEIRTRLVR